MSKSGLRTSYYRLVQKLMPFEITKDSEVTLSDDQDKMHGDDERPVRRGAREGQQLRKLRDIYF